MDERLRFVAAHESKRHSMTELCQEFGISRKTGYKLLRRYQTEGLMGLLDRSRAPRSSPHRISYALEEQILVVRRAHPTWGSKKILASLVRDASGVRWPARSTVDAILKRSGLVPDRRRRRYRPSREAPVVQAQTANDVWSADYKGWFRLGDGTRCEPLTINDVFSRFSLKCTAYQRPSWVDVKIAFERCFREYGLPRAILTDNGTPFGSSGIAGLTRLSVWFLRLGIQPCYIQPGKPYQNGKHERFHLTLKREAASPPRSTGRAQQRAFNRFRYVYNHQRPHEALQMRTPAELYSESPRVYRGLPPNFEYDAAFETRRVNRHGYLSWGGEPVFVGEAMRGQTVGLESTSERSWLVHLGPVVLGEFHERSRLLVPPVLDS